MQLRVGLTEIGGFRDHDGYDHLRGMIIIRPRGHPAILVEHGLWMDAERE